MIKFQELKQGDYVIADYEGNRELGEITQIQRDQKLAMVNNGVQEFWYSPDQLHAIPLDGQQLERLRFSHQENEDGSVKYMKGAFRILLPQKDNFSRFEIWYRDEKRQIMQPIHVHELQNHFYEMTKVHLNTGSFD